MPLTSGKPEAELKDGEVQSNLTPRYLSVSFIQEFCGSITLIQNRLLRSFATWRAMRQLRTDKDPAHGD